MSDSCRNRHCPRCQTRARDRWIQARSRDLLPVSYAHVVFTIHHALTPLALQNKGAVYGLLLRASADTLLEIARDPEHLGAEIGFFSVLHTWNQQLLLHPHVHCVVPAGGLALDHSRWISTSPRFFLPVEVLAEVFRGKFTEGLRELYKARQLVLEGVLAPLRNPRTFAELLRTAHQKDWVVYAKRPFGGAEHVVHYLARYTHRVAISSHRLLSLEDHSVTFRWRDSRHYNKQRQMTLSVHEFLRRFSAACAADRVRADPLFRVLRASKTEGVAAAVRAVAGRLEAASFLASSRGGGASAMDLPGLRRADAGDRAADSAPNPPARAAGERTLRMKRSFSTSKISLPRWPRPTCFWLFDPCRFSALNPVLLLALSLNGKPILTVASPLFPELGTAFRFQNPKL